MDVERADHKNIFSRRTLPRIRHGRLGGDQPALGCRGWSPNPQRRRKRHGRGYRNSRSFECCGAAIHGCWRGYVHAVLGCRCEEAPGSERQRKESGQGDTIAIPGIFFHAGDGYLFVYPPGCCGWLVRRPRAMRQRQENNVGASSAGDSICRRWVSSFTHHQPCMGQSDGKTEKM